MAMARPIEFDKGEVLQGAMEAFWKQGFRETSMQDLVRATGLHPGSIYGAFGNKRRLFLEALQLYFDMRGEQATKVLNTPDSPLQGIRDYFDGMLEGMLGDRASSGCLLINTAIEFAGRDAEISLEVDRMFTDNEARLRDALERAQACGELRTQRSPEDIARYLLVGVRGLRVYARSQPGRTALRSCIDQLLECLEDKH